MKGLFYIPDVLGPIQKICSHCHGDSHWYIEKKKNIYPGLLKLFYCQQPPQEVPGQRAGVLEFRGGNVLFIQPGCVCEPPLCL